MAKDLTKNPVKLLVIGGSAGSLEVIIKVFPDLPDMLPFAIIIVLCRKQNTDNVLVDLLAAKTRHPVIEANEKDTLKMGTTYKAPADYHFLIESDRTLSLDYSE